MVKQLLLLTLALSSLSAVRAPQPSWDFSRETTHQERQDSILRDIRERQFPAVQQGPLSERTCGLVRLSMRVESLLASMRREGAIYAPLQYRALHSAMVGSVVERMVRDEEQNICPGIPDPVIARHAAGLLADPDYNIRIEDLTPNEAARLQQLATNRATR